MLRPVALALELEALGASFVVVGSAARAVRGLDVRPADLDVVVRPRDVDAFVAAARALGSDLTMARLLRCRDVRSDTAWGPLDVFVTEVEVVAVVAGEHALRVAA